MDDAGSHDETSSWAWDIETLICAWRISSLLTSTIAKTLEVCWKLPVRYAGGDAPSVFCISTSTQEGK